MRGDLEESQHIQAGDQFAQMQQYIGELERLAGELGTLLARSKLDSFFADMGYDEHVPSRDQYMARYRAALAQCTELGL